MYFYWDSTYILVIIGAIICMAASAKVKTTFNTLQSGGKVEFNDFYNIMDFIKNSESAFNTFHKVTGVAKDDYDTLVNTIISKTEDWN